MSEYEAYHARQRVSCAGLCVITNAQGHYLLGLNQARLARGKAVYTPIGGALRYHHPYLLQQFAAVQEDATNHDLRLFMPPACVDAFRDWFHSRINRETTPFRELYEELVEEFQLLDWLNPFDVEMKYLHTYENVYLSERSGGSIATRYFHDIFRVTFCSEAARLAVENAHPSTGLRWFSYDELVAGVSADGAKLNAETILTAL